MPGAGIAELVRAAGAQGWSGTPQVEGLVLQAPLVLPESGAQRVQVVLTETSEQGLTASVYSQPAESLADAAWTLHATARIGKQAVAVPGPAGPCGRCRNGARVHRGGSAVCAHWPMGDCLRPGDSRDCGPLWTKAGEALAEVACLLGRIDGYGVHPVLLDSAFQPLVAGIRGPWELICPSRWGASRCIRRARKPAGST